MWGYFLRVTLPKATCECGGHIKANTSRFKRHQIFELPKIQPVVTEYQQVYGACTQCKTYHFGPLPEGVPKGMLGVRAMSAVAVLTADYHLRSCNKITLPSRFTEP